MDTNDTNLDRSAFTDKLVAELERNPLPLNRHERRKILCLYRRTKRRIARKAIARKRLAEIREKAFMREVARMSHPDRARALTARWLGKSKVTRADIRAARKAGIHSVPERLMK